MSARSGIAKAMAAGLAADVTGSEPYINDLFGNVDNKVTHFDEVNSWPYISVTPGTESREDQPSNFTMGTLRLNILIYVNNATDAQGELENLITDIETYLDTHLRLDYEATTPSGTETHSTLDNTIRSISTDEGILDPNAVGEVIVDVRYEKLRKFN